MLLSLSSRKTFSGEKLIATAVDREMSGTTEDSTKTLFST